MKVNNVEGSLVKLIILPYLDSTIKYEKEREDIQILFYGDKYDKMSEFRKKIYRFFHNKVRYDQEAKEARLREIEIKLTQEV